MLGNRVTEPAVKRKLVILNNGLKDHRGHYFETSISLAEAARANGWTPILATHATCRMDMLPPWLSVFPLFTTDHWMVEPPAAAPDVAGAVTSPYDRAFTSFEDVQAGRAALITWIADRFDLPPVEVHSTSEATLDDGHSAGLSNGWRHRIAHGACGGLHQLRRAIRVAQRVAWCGERVQFYLVPPYVDLLLRRFASVMTTPLLLTIPRILQPRFYPRLEERLTEVLTRDRGDTNGSRPVEKRAREELSPDPATRQLMTAARQRLTELGIRKEFDHAQLFLRDLERLTAMADIGPRDHVLLGTAHFRELLAVDWFTSRLGRERSPSFHLEFRHPLFCGDPSEEAVEASESLRLQRGVFQLHPAADRSQRIRLYTDTEELRAEYELLTKQNFGVFPIPFRAELISSRSTAQSGPLTLVFLGDARDEKGFHWLPDLIERMTADYLQPRRVRFLLQATLGTPAYNPLSGPAMTRLKQFPLSQVELVGEKGPLSPEKYYELASKADIVLLPYERNRYRAASSGTLAEAIAAGRPAVVPADSWMSSQLAPGAGATFQDFESFVSAVCHVVDHYARYRSAAETHRREWLKRHSPAALVAAIGATELEPVPAALSAA